MMLAFILASIMAAKRAPKFGIKSEYIQDATLIIVVAGVLGARLTYIALNWKEEFASNPSSALTLKFDGLTSFGSLVFGGIAAAYFCRVKKINIMSFFDALSLPVLVAQAIGRLGCFLNGCCYGTKVLSSPPGVHMHGLEGFYLPAQLYDAGMVLIGALGIYLLEKKSRSIGYSFGMMLVFYGTSRYIYEFWRIGASSKNWGSMPFSQAQAMAWVMILGGVLIVINSNRKGILTPNNA